jgi:hypothetical protein
MKDVHVISIIGLIYAVILAVVTLIFFNEYDYPLWAVLGSAVALFNHSLMIQLTKSTFSTSKIVSHLVQRYVFYFIIILIVWLDTKALGTQVLINSYIFLLLGIFSVKVGIFIYHTPLIKKKVEKVEKTDDQSDTDIS